MQTGLTLENIVDSLPDGVLVIDAEFTIFFANAVFARQVGRPAADLVGRKCHQVFSGPFCGTGGCPVTLVQTIGKARIFQGGKHCKIIDPKMGPVTTAPLRDAHGNFRGVVEHVSDGDAVARTHLQHSDHNGMRKIMGAIIQAMSTTIEKRDPYTAGHQRRVAKLCRAIATLMDFSWDRIQGLRMAAAVHDLGKILVPAAILNKPGPMSEHEMAIIRMHPRTAYDILKGIQFPWPLAEIIYQHHERLDGSGYPRGLKGDRILMEARILAVADVVESMASFRPYRQSLNLDAALEELQRYRGVRYDERVVDICIDLLVNKGFDFQTKAWLQPVEKSTAAPADSRPQDG